MNPKLRLVAALVGGLLVGAVATIAVQGGGTSPRSHGSASRSNGAGASSPAAVAGRAETYLAWVPSSLPAGLAAGIGALDGIDHTTVVAEDNTWMTRSWSADGQVVDHPPAPFMIPIDAAAVDPRSFRDFLPSADRGVLNDLARGQGVVGATSSELRGLGPGAVLRFEGGSDVTIAAVLPDELVGAAEVLVSRATGAEIGITHDRYVLIQPAGPNLPSARKLANRIRPLLPTTLDPVHRKVVVRAPGETPYLRQGDAVLPPVLIKALFGEFAARPDPSRPGYLRIDPAWYRQQIETTTVPVLGPVTCNRAVIPQLRDAMQTVVKRGLAGTIHVYDGCYAPRYINRDPANMISHHAWGIAFDCNASTNPVGGTPHQDPRLVRVMEQAGFIWGGTFVVPDGNHFEYRFTPTT